MLHYLEVGGPILWLLFIMSILSLAVALERIFFFMANEKGVGKTFKADINKLVSEDKIEEAIALCDSKKSCISASVKKFLKRTKKGSTVEDYESVIKEIVIEEMDPFGKRMHCLSSIAAIAPMCGLLGTVTGMIKAFSNISKFGSGDATVVANGISEALLTTAAGLIIAIPVIVVYNFLNRKLENIELEIDKIVTNIINIFRR